MPAYTVPAVAGPGDRHTASPAPQVKTIPIDSPVEDEILISVSKALRHAKLLSRPDQCYVYRFDSPADQPAYTVDVRENHSHAECGGDPQTQPHLFTVRIDKATRALSQDAKSPGVFKPIAP